MAKYLIEFRFFGKAKGEIKSLIWEVNKRFHIRPRYRPVPHVSLVGSFTTKDEKRLVNTFKQVCKNQNIMKYDVIGFNTFEENRVVFIDIKPDDKMDDFRWELSKNLQPFCNLKSYDYERDFKFHATLAFKLDRKKYEKVKSYIKRKKEPHFKHIVVRVTLIKNGKILREYDFLLRKLLNRKAAKSRSVNRQTTYYLKKFFEGKYDPNKNINYISEKSFIDRIKSFFRD
jgi:2'-5' RNA ligase